MSKYYFFRDLDNESNLLDGKTFHAAGYVEKMYCELETPNPSGKDLAVTFFEPFEGTITSAWRALDEVELFEVSEMEHEQLVKSYDVMNGKESQASLKNQLKEHYTNVLVKDYKYQMGDDDYQLSTAEFAITRALKTILSDLPN